MYQKLLIATKNPGKIHELTQFLSDLPLQLIFLRDVYLDDEEVDEDKNTYKENAVKKSQIYAKMAGIPALSDDEGIEIEALGGAPGVRSSRWLGHTSTDEELINYMMHITKTLPKDNRTAFFKTVLSFSLPNGQTWTTNGQIQGIIAETPNMNLLKKYPYKSFFYIPELKKYYHESELTTDEQKEYNHRYIAANKLKPIILREMQNQVQL